MGISRHADHVYKGILIVCGQMLARQITPTYRLTHLGAIGADWHVCLVGRER
jgi:hypothetical protein